MATTTPTSEPATRAPNKRFPGPQQASGHSCVDTLGAQVKSDNRELNNHINALGSGLNSRLDQVYELMPTGTRQGQRSSTVLLWFLGR